MTLLFPTGGGPFWGEEPAEAVETDGISAAKFIVLMLMNVNGMLIISFWKLGMLLKSVGGTLSISAMWGLCLDQALDLLGIPICWVHPHDFAVASSNLRQTPSPV